MTDSLDTFLAMSTTPWHAADQLALRLTAAGFTELDETDPWSLRAGGKHFVRRGGSALAAFTVGSRPTAGWTIAAAHTDSPGWRLKLAQQRAQGGFVRIGTEVYGSPIHATWFDRPLAVAGRLFVREDGVVREKLVRTEPLGLFPNLAIHYNREVNKGQAYDLADHLHLVADLAGAEDLQSFLAGRLGFRREDWLSGDLFAVVGLPPTSLGPGGLYAAPRIDNLTGCHAVVEALIAAADHPREAGRVAFCFDQEEIGSSTWTGADSSFLGDLLSRVHGLTGGTAEEFFRAKAASFVLSVDAAHGLHPNWEKQHDEAYAPTLGGGPVLKSSARFSYATTGASEALVRDAAADAGVNLQTFVMRSNLVPGSTVGPITTSWTGIPGADVGIPIWAMHSAVETAHRADQAGMIALVGRLFG